MRSKTTNVLQGVVLLTGIVYLIIGASFYASPYKICKLLVAGSDAKSNATISDSDGESIKKGDETPDLTEDEWLKQIINDEIISPLYYIFRIFAALLMVSGIAMIMPLFDPLRYRGLVYYNGLIFSFIASVSIFLFIHSQKVINDQIAGEAGKDAVTWQVGHLIMTILGSVFTAIFVLNAISLVITRKQAQAGKE